MKKRSLLLLGTMLAAAMTTSLSASDSRSSYFEVTVTNLTRAQQFTPILLASHRAGVHLFTLGEPASAPLATLAEEGNTAPLADSLNANPGVLDVIDSGALLDPGKSVTLRVRTRDGFDHLSLASMLIPTNDGFIALNGISGPRLPNVAARLSVAYDAGSERNDETCASIPGPSFAECGGPGGGGMPVGSEEGYVHVHAGIHGIGDFNEAERDWRNPVARVVIRRLP